MGKDKRPFIYQSPRRKRKPRHALHSPQITKAKKAEPLTAEELFAQASGDVQDSHWDAIVAHAIQMGKGE